MKYQINKGFIVQKLDDKIVIFDSEESVLYTFNKTASFIFQKLKRGLNENKIIEAMVKKYSVREEKARKDYQELIDELRRKKIISLKK